MKTKFKVIGRKSARHRKTITICYGLSCRSAAEQSGRFWSKRGYVDCKVESYESAKKEDGVPLSELF